MLWVIAAQVNPFVLREMMSARSRQSGLFKVDAIRELPSVLVGRLRAINVATWFIAGWVDSSNARRCSSSLA